MVREENPVSWPEVMVLQNLHGEANVFDAAFVRSEPSNVQTEKLRLLSIYGKEALDDCYPGARPFMEMDYPGEKDPISVSGPSGVRSPARVTRSRSRHDGQGSRMTCRSASRCPNCAMN